MKLTDRLRGLNAEHPPFGAAHEAADRIDQLEAENAELRKDAERYAYLRDIKRRECLVKNGRAAGVWCDCEDEAGTLILLTEDDLDAAIDAAMEGE